MIQISKRQYGVPCSLSNSSKQLALPQLRSRSVDRCSPALSQQPALRLDSKKFLMKDGKLCKVTKPEPRKSSRSRIILGKLIAPRNKSAEINSPVAKTVRTLKKVSFQADGKENIFPVAGEKPTRPRRSPSVPEKTLLQHCPARVDVVLNSFYKRLENSEALVDVAEVVSNAEVSCLLDFLPRSSKKKRENSGTPVSSFDSENNKE